MPEYLEKIILPCADGSQREVAIPNNDTLIMELRSGIAAILNAITRRSSVRFMNETDFYNSADPYTAGDIVLMTSDETNEVIAVLDNAAGDGQRKLLWSKNPEYNMLVGEIARCQYDGTHRNIYHNDELAFIITNIEPIPLKLKFNNDIIDLGKEWQERYFFGGGGYVKYALTESMASVANIPHIGVVISERGLGLGSYAVADLRGIRFLREAGDRPNYITSNILRVTATEKLIVDKQIFMLLDNHEYFMYYHTNPNETAPPSAPLDFYFDRVEKSQCFISGNSESITVHANSFRICQNCFSSNRNLKHLLIDCDDVSLGEADCAFAYCPQLTEIDLSAQRLQSSHGVSLKLAFNGCHALKALKLGTMDLSGMTEDGLYMAFAGCQNLERIEGDITGICSSVSFADSPLSRDMGVKIINALADLSGIKRTIEFSAYTYGKLWSSDIANATSKGWTVSKATEPETT